MMCFKKELPAHNFVTRWQPPAGPYIWRWVIIWVRDSAIRVGPNFAPSYTVATRREFGHRIESMTAALLAETSLFSHMYSNLKILQTWTACNPSLLPFSIYSWPPPLCAYSCWLYTLKLHLYNKILCHTSSGEHLNKKWVLPARPPLPVIMEKEARQQVAPTAISSAHLTKR